VPQYIILSKRHYPISYNNFYNSGGQISSIQTPPVGIGALDPPDCTIDADCADDVFCSGDETCVNGACEAGTDPCPGGFCNEGLDACVECLENAHCYDGAFCNGVETCDVGTGNCVNGDVPCNPDTETCAEGPDQAVCVPVDGEVVKVKVPRFINPKNRGVTPIKLVSDMDVEFAEVTCGDAQHERPRQKYFSKYDKTLAIGKFKTKDLGFECGYNTTLTCTGKFADGTEFMGESNKFKCKYKRKDDYDDYDDDKRGHYNDDDDKRDRDDDDDDDDDRNKRYSYKRD